MNDFVEKLFLGEAKPCRFPLVTQKSVKLLSQKILEVLVTRLG